MNTSELFKKENIYKALAIVLLLVFIFSSFAIGFLGNGGRNNEQNIIPQQYLEQEIIVNATVRSYQPYIILDSNVTDAVRKIAGVDEIMSTSQGYVVSVSDKASVPIVYAELQKLNITGKSNAIIALQPIIEMKAENGSIMRVAGGEIITKLEPIFVEGENFSVRLFVRAQEGRIIGYGQVTVLPSLGEFVRNATVVALAGTTTKISIPWERRVDAEQYVHNLSSQFGASNLTYSRKDYIITNSTNTKPPYVKLVAGTTLYVGNYTNKTQVALDFPGAEFPDSVIIVDGNASGFEGLNTTYTYLYNMKVVEEGQPIFFALRSAKLYFVNDSVEVMISGYALKGKLISVISAREN